MNTDADHLITSDVAAVLHPYTQLERHQATGPTVMVKGDGVYVIDARGKRYLEAMSGLWSTALGFSQQRLVEAANRQMSKLPYYQLFKGNSTEPAIELASRLLNMTQEFGFDKVLFANSGSEANDQAVKLIWYYFNAVGQPQRKKIISRRRGYHGVSVMTGSLTGLPGNHTDFDLPIDRVVHTDCPSHYHEGRPGEGVEAFVERLGRQLEQLIEREGPQTIAAFFAEPVQGAGGVIVPPPGYFERIQPVLRRHGILLVADEVITGFGRTGRMFGSQRFDLKPDLMTVAKALSSSYLPISATLMSAPIFQAVAQASARNGVFSHGVTYAGHPVCAAVANEALMLYDELGIVGQVRALEPHFQSRLRALASHPLVGEARGVGLIGALEIVADKQAKRPFQGTAGVGNAIQSAAAERGLIVRGIRDAIAVCPPLIITHDQIDELFDKFALALDDCVPLARQHGLQADTSP